MLAGRLLSVAAGAMGASEAVTIELLRLVGVVISCVASILAAWLAFRNGREARDAKREAMRARREARSRRHAVRDPEREGVLLVDAVRVEPDDQQPA